jgi:hypothetical protein
MTQITLRGLKPELERQIRKISQKSGKSLNRIILDMIYQQTGLKKTGETMPGESLRKLAGGWSEKDAAEFFESIKSSEQIDEGMWE